MCSTRTIRRAMRALSKVNSIVIKTNKTKTTQTMSTLTHMNHIWRWLLCFLDLQDWFEICSKMWGFFFAKQVNTPVTPGFKEKSECKNTRAPGSKYTRASTPFSKEQILFSQPACQKRKKVGRDYVVVNNGNVFFGHCYLEQLQETSYLGLTS
jgi:hypothetical protein